ncbi:hypothetical protein OA862_00235 [Candidatus Pelagibacter sp.]|nr:hypothetical protein [Candidatus Pelagibacter sp.]
MKEINKSKNNFFFQIIPTIRNHMRWNKKYDYPISSRATEDGIRRYALGEAKLPSVTSILDATKSEEDKAALANWRERTGHKEAEAITKAASSRGSQMHSYLESFLLGRENLSFFEDNEQYKKMAKEIIDKGLTNRLEEIYGVECTMYYPERYAGTADCVGVYEGKETIIDFKQSNKPKKAEYIDSWFLQTAAYTLAHNVVYNTNINACVILVCTVDNLFQEFKIQGPELITYQNLFLGRLKKFNEMNNLV